MGASRMKRTSSGHFLTGIVQRIRLEQIEAELARRAAAVPTQTLRLQAAELVEVGGWAWPDLVDS